MAKGGSTELASAYLTLIPSLKGASAKIENDLRNMNLTKAGGYMGNSLSSGFLGKLKGAAAVGVKTLGALGGAVVGIAATGGIARALKIDQATMKFENMGIAVEEALASCNEAVTGTAYGLDAAATVASSLAASGVQIGDEMTSSLKAVAGMAAMSGRSMEDVGLIFGKVAAQGKLQGDELTQFAESGINATAALAKHLGVTQQEVRKLVSEGVIDFQTFSDAMYATFGEAAQGANETFTGAMSNTMAALSRIGAKFATPGLENLRKVFVALIPAINAISTLMDPLVEKFTTFTTGVSSRAVAGIEAFTEALTNTGSIVSGFKWLLDAAFEGTAIGTLVGKINGFTAAVRAGTSPVALLKAYMEEFGDYMSGVLAPAMEVFSSAMENAYARFGFFAGVFAAAFAALHGPISAAAAGLAAIAPWLLKVKDFFIVLGAYVSQCGGGLLGLSRVLLAVVNPVTVAVAVVAALVAGFVSLMSTNEGFRASVMEVVGQITQSLAPALLIIQQTLGGLASTLLPLMTGMIDMLVPVLGQIVLVVLQVAAALAPLVATIVATLVPILATLIQNIALVVSSMLSMVVPAINFVLGLVQTALPLIQAIVETCMTNIQNWMAVIMAVIQGDWEGAWTAIQNFLSDAWSGIQNILSVALGIAEGLLDSALSWISGLWSSCWDSVSAFLAHKWDEIVRSLDDKGKEVVGFFKNLPQNILNALGDLGSLLYEAGKSIISGLVSGATEWWDKKKAFFEDIAGWIQQHKGPKEYDLQLLVPNGGWIMQSLITGMEKGMPSLRETLSGITDSISSAIQPDFSDFGSGQMAFSASGYTGSSRRGNGEASPVYNITLNADIKDFEGIQTLNDLYDVLVRAKAVNPTRR